MANKFDNNIKTIINDEGKAVITIDKEVCVEMAQGLYEAFESYKKRGLDEKADNIVDMWGMIISKISNPCNS